MAYPGTTPVFFGKSHSSFHQPQTLQRFQGKPISRIDGPAGKHISIITDKIRETSNFSMFTTPGIVIFLLVVILPFIYGFYLTFTDWNGVSETKHLVGFANYVETFRDVEFWKSMQ